LSSSRSGIPLIPPLFVPAPPGVMTYFNSNIYDGVFLKCFSPIVYCQWIYSWVIVHASKTCITFEITVFWLESRDSALALDFLDPLVWLEFLELKLWLESCLIGDVKLRLESCLVGEVKLGFLAGVLLFWLDSLDPLLVDELSESDRSRLTLLRSFRLNDFFIPLLVRELSESDLSRLTLFRSFMLRDFLVLGGSAGGWNVFESIEHLVRN
jgi:hypothetical protein